MPSRSKMGMRRQSFRSLSNLHSPSPWLEEERSLTLTQPHFLDCCFLCHRRLASHNDIFMYRGDTAFCTEECREEQIEIDEAKERSARRAGLKKKASKRNDGERAKARGVLVAV